MDVTPPSPPAPPSAPDRVDSLLREAVTHIGREDAEPLLVHALGVPENDYCLNFSIARGLDYYTGTVYETQLDGYPQIGSICSGGRYEDLASHYTKSKLPGVGMAAPFGQSLHVSGTDRAALEAAIAPYRRPPYRWAEVPPSLEDVFIRLMETSEDNFQ